MHRYVYIHTRTHIVCRYVYIYIYIVYILIAENYIELEGSGRYVLEGRLRVPCTGDFKMDLEPLKRRPGWATIFMLALRTVRPQHGS